MSVVLVLLLLLEGRLMKVYPRNQPLILEGLAEELTATGRHLETLTAKKSLTRPVTLSQSQMLRSFTKHWRT
tara:strand:- start:415 stop:630 length:216 start_codon:yes stop_codon:yes gene_type:complete